MLNEERTGIRKGRPVMDRGTSSTKVRWKCFKFLETGGEGRWTDQYSLKQKTIAFNNSESHEGMEPKEVW